MTTLFPRIPYMARWMTDPDVPAAGPLIATIPGRIHSRLAAMLMRIDCQTSRPMMVRLAPTVKLRTLMFGAAQTANRSRALPCRSASVTISIPLTSGVLAESTYSEGAEAGTEVPFEVTSVVAGAEPSIGHVTNMLLVTYPITWGI